MVCFWSCGIFWVILATRWSCYMQCLDVDENIRIHKTIQLLMQMGSHVIIWGFPEIVCLSSSWSGYLCCSHGKFNSTNSYTSYPPGLVLHDKQPWHTRVFHTTSDTTPLQTIQYNTPLRYQHCHSKTTHQSTSDYTRHHSTTNNATHHYVTNNTPLNSSQH